MATFVRVLYIFLGYYKSYIRHYFDRKSSLCLSGIEYSGRFHLLLRGDDTLGAITGLGDTSQGQIIVGTVFQITYEGNTFSRAYSQVCSRAPN